MDYLGKKCPVCDRYFHAGDDIVVCPDCGTPHHRECYEKENQCANHALHAQAFDYNTASETDEEEHVCSNCGTHNDKTSFFCKHCGVPLHNTEQQAQRQNDPRTQYQNPGAQGSQGFQYDMFDPLGGVDKDEDFGDGVTAGEAAKYVKQNPPYFIRIFSNIQKYAKSRFNFSAALFTGIYLLYRKMYKIGALISAIQLSLFILYTVIYYSAPYQDVLNNMPSLSFTDVNAFSDFLSYASGLSSLQIFMIYFLLAYDLIRIGFMLAIGFTFNRLYFQHCKKQINKVKAEAPSPQEAESQLQTKGGVNTAIGVTMMITFLVVNYLPFILSNFI